jgi:HSP20 family protein
MSAITRIEPRDELLRDPFPDFFRRFMHMADWPLARGPEDMKLDVTENPKEYIVKAEIPGAKKEDIHVTVEGNYVSISVEVKDEKRETRKDEGERVLLQELRYGSMTRGFTLPQDVDAKGTSAKFDNGVLSVTLPKREPAVGTSVSVQ